MLLRPLTPADAAQVQAFVRGLSQRSRYERFFTPIAELSPRQLERITAGAGFSIGAFDAAGRLVGLAEYARSSVTHTRNRAMRLLARRLGFGVQPDEDPDLVRMELALAA